jgi:hypothetical protein
MGMERETGREGPIWQVTPRLLVVTVAATTAAVAYGLLLWWANPSDPSGLNGIGEVTCRGPGLASGRRRSRA